MNEKIDFVILWVDGNDEKWLKEKRKYIPEYNTSNNNGKSRFRDWDNLQYWFRAVEANAPWVNNIFFITYGHLPKWLNTNHEKLKIIKHSDYIPQEYLPTYNSNTIEMNLFRIKELSENFVLFNDDMFILNKTSPEDFFKKGLPVECFLEEPLYSTGVEDAYSHTLLNNMYILNKYVNKKESYKKNIKKFLSFKYSFKENFKNIVMSSFDRFVKIGDRHVAVSLKKSILEKLWELEPDVFDNSSRNRFRGLNDVSQYLIRYYQLGTGMFEPRKTKETAYIILKDDNTNLLKNIDKKIIKHICFNDTPEIMDFDQSKKTLNEYLAKKFPNKSSFEK